MKRDNGERSGSIGDTKEQPESIIVKPTHRIVVEGGRLIVRRVVELETK